MGDPGRSQTRLVHLHRATSIGSASTRPSATLRPSGPTGTRANTRVREIGGESSARLRITTRASTSILSGGMALIPFSFRRPLSTLSLAKRARQPQTATLGTAASCMTACVLSPSAWLNDRSCVPLWSLQLNHFLRFQLRAHADTRKANFSHLTLIDEHIQSYLAFQGARRIRNLCVIEAVADAICLCGTSRFVVYITAHVFWSGWLSGTRSTTTSLNPSTSRHRPRTSSTGAAKPRLSTSVSCQAS